MLPGDQMVSSPPASVPRGGRRGAPLWKTPWVLLGIVVCVTVALVVAPSDARAPISGLSQMLSMLFALFCTSIMLVRSERGRARWAWGIIALGQFLFVFGDIAIIVESSQPNASPTSVSLADLFLLPLSPLLAVGAILFPAVPTTWARQVRILLDVSIAVGAVLGLALVFLIAPRFLSGTTQDIIFIVYPIADTTLLLALLVLLARGVQSRYRPVFLWMVLGMVFLLYGDTAFNYLTLPGLSGTVYSLGLPSVDPAWVAMALAFSLAPLSFLRQRHQSDAPWLEKLIAFTSLLQPTRLLNQFLVLVLPVGVLVGLLLYLNAQSGPQEGTFPLIALTAVVFLLIITRQLLTQRDLVDARLATERAEQLDSLKDQFITSVNHELRTPLMTMQGYIELLSAPEGQNASAEKRTHMLSLARIACANLVHLVKSILDVRQIEGEASNFVPEAVDVRMVVEAALTLIDPNEVSLQDRRLNLRIPQALTVWGDRVRIQQIITNLVSNALKYSPPETPVTLTAVAVSEKSSRLIGAKSGKQHLVEILVQDQGLGIPPEQRDLLFRRFVRLPREIAGNIHGNGLGLYLCRVFAEAMGGSIWVESSGVEGEGSTFHLHLPVPVPPVEEAATVLKGYARMAE